MKPCCCNSYSMWFSITFVFASTRLNARQARCILFFTRFNLTITYRPGSCNIKPDALSLQFATTDSSILSRASAIGSLTWEIKTLIEDAQQDEPGPRNKSPIHFFNHASCFSTVFTSWIRQWNEVISMSKAGLFLMPFQLRPWRSHTSNMNSKALVPWAQRDIWLWGGTHPLTVCRPDGKLQACAFFSWCLTPTTMIMVTVSDLL